MVTLANRPPRSLLVLLVEDNLGDATLITEAFKISKRPILVTRVKDGEAALRYLRGEGGYVQAQRPDLILLDLNMPKKSGIEVLEEIKADQRFQDIPVVILTNSSLDSDVKRAYESKASHYITKPVDLDQLFKSMRYVEEVWLGGLDDPID